MLIAIEGVDGAGTTTQSRRLVDWLEARGRKAHLTREPSTGPIGALLREMLGGRHAPVDKAALALLFAADRLDHLAREIEPARAAGAIVVSDRYVMSSLAYQSLDVPHEFVARINERATAADLTVLVDVPVEVAAERRRRRGGQLELFDALEVQRQLVQAYRVEAARAQAAGHAVILVDGTPGEEEVFAQLCAAVARACALTVSSS